MNYIFIINDFRIGSSTFNARDIESNLLKEEEWILKKSSPFLKKIKEEDKVLIYLAGDGRRYFSANFTISKPVRNLNKDDGIYKYFDFYVEIKNIKKFNKKIFIKDIKKDLNFIKDKKNYGLFLRQSIKKIEKEDYNLIVKKLLEKNN